MRAALICSRGVLRGTDEAGHGADGRANASVGGSDGRLSRFDAMQQTKTFTRFADRRQSGSDRLQFRPSYQRLARSIGVDGPGLFQTGHFCSVRITAFIDL